jgi:hypothetical protein
MMRSSMIAREKDSEKWSEVGVTPGQAGRSSDAPVHERDGFYKASDAF